MDGDTDIRPVENDSHSDHLLDPGYDKILAAPSPLGAEMVEGCRSDWGSDELEVRAQTPPRAQGAGAFLVSLSAGSEPATCPPGTGGAACTPCTQPIRMPLDSLCDQLTKALTPVLARIPNREPVALKRRPRQKRQPVSNPRCSVRLARGVGHGSNASK